MIVSQFELGRVPTPNVPHDCLYNKYCYNSGFELPVNSHKLLGYQWHGESALVQETIVLAKAAQEMLNNPQLKSEFEDMDAETKYRFLDALHFALSNDNLCFTNLNGFVTPRCQRYINGTCEPIIGRHEQSFPYPIVIPNPKNNVVTTSPQAIKYGSN